MPYCTKDEINSLFGDISDDISEDMFSTVIENSTAWIDSNLKRNYVPLPKSTVEIVENSNEDTIEVTESAQSVIYNLINVPAGLRTAAIYYAASDILLSLYHGNDLPVQYDIWFQKAQALLDDYITAYLHVEDLSSETVDGHQKVKHSNSLTYNQKRGRRRLGRWVK